MLVVTKKLKKAIFITILFILILSLIRCFITGVFLTLKTSSRFYLLEFCLVPSIINFSSNKIGGQIARRFMGSAMKEQSPDNFPDLHICRAERLIRYCGLIVTQFNNILTYYFK